MFKGQRTQILCPSLLFCSIIFTCSNTFFFDLGIKFGKTKQIVVALIATALKAPLTVTKANRRSSRCKLNIGNIYDFFINIFTHVFPHNIKRCATEATHRKTPTPIVAKQKTNDMENTIHKLAESTFLPLFTNLCKKAKGYKTPYKNKAFS